MSKPKKPPTFEELKQLWVDYFIRYEKYRQRERRYNRRYAEKNCEKIRLRKKLYRIRNPYKNRHIVSLDMPVGDEGTVFRDLINPEKLRKVI